ncbi:MAG TPA: hypothetical protein VHZ50_11320, partial [Puia sp.]|nr:hypothetical protein [Puia sp.]
MFTQAIKSLKELLIKQEGIRLFPYTDTTGHLTIGVGRNLVDTGIRNDEALYMLDNDIEYFNEKLEEALPYYRELDDSRQVV